MKQFLSTEGWSSKYFDEALTAGMMLGWAESDGSLSCKVQSRMAINLSLISLSVLVSAFYL